MAAGFLALCESSVRYTGQNGSTFTSFAFFRVNGAIRDCLRKRQTHEELEPYYDELTLDNFESTSATFLDVNEVIASKLSPQQKVVVELRLKGWKNHEIAEHLGKTEVRTSQVFKFALDRLRGAL
jgi:RNA polymerase sigma factor (sigma-70 family)